MLGILLGKLNKLSRILMYVGYAILGSSLLACSQNGSVIIAPQVQFKPLIGKQFDTASLKGQVTLLNFWATSCSTCVHEMPMLAQVYTAYAPKGYRMVAVAMDYDRLDFVQNFATSRALPFNVVYDADGNIAKAFDGVKLTPTSYLIDKQGRIVKRYVGEPKLDELKATIETLLVSNS
jgi:thiol-disulfide isomerase/thioredoxin